MRIFLLTALLLFPHLTSAQGAVAYAQADGEWWMIDTAGKRIKPVDEFTTTLRNGNAEDTMASEGFFTVRQGTWPEATYRYFDSKWNALIDSAFDYAEPFSGHFGLVMSGDQVNAVDTAGKFLLVKTIPAIHPANTVQSLLEDRILVLQKEKDKICNCGLNGPSFGYKRKDGSWVIEPRFRSADIFHHGRALVSEDGLLYGYIDLQGRWAIPPVYDGGMPFAEE
jgi:hypothetical protein